MHQERRTLASEQQQSGQEWGKSKPCLNAMIWFATPASGSDVC